MELVTYKKFKTEEEAVPLVDILKSNDISYQTENISAAVDMTFTGGTELEDKIVIKLNEFDFELFKTDLENYLLDKKYISSH